MKREYTFDRIEGEIAVCFSRDDGKIAELSAEALREAGVPEGGIFSADLEGDEILSIEYLAEKTEAKKRESRRRLSALFNRGKGEKR